MPWILLALIAGGIALALSRKAPPSEVAPPALPPKPPGAPPPPIPPEETPETPGGFININSDGWLLNLPKNAVDRDAAILARIGNLEFEYWDIQIQGKNHLGVFRVFRDAAKIDGVRITVTARCAQQIADRLHASLTTPAIEDWIYSQSNLRLPVVVEALETMSTNKVMISHSRKLDALVGGESGLIGNVGKSWSLANGLLTHPGMAMNYGLFTRSSKHLSVTGKFRVIQQPGYRHNLAHYDYIQNLRLISRSCIVDGQTIDLWDVYESPSLSELVSTEGVLKVVRQPGVVEPVGGVA